MGKKVLNLKLTLLQQKFCQEYLKHFNGTKAYQMAYKAKTNVAAVNASKLLRNTKVQAYLAKKADKQAEKADITVQEVIADLKIMKDRCMQACQVLNKKGKPTGVWKFDSSGAIKSLELLGRYLTMFSDKLIVKHDLSDLLEEIENESERGLPKVKK